MSVEETIRELIKEELEAQLDEINEKLSTAARAGEFEKIYSGPVNAGIQ